MVEPVDLKGASPTTDAGAGRSIGRVIEGIFGSTVISEGSRCKGKLLGYGDGRGS